jgi:HlyD family secretion protein
VNSRLFRNASLERLSSPEQLDQLLSVTDARGWILLVSFVVLLSTAIIWGFVGSIPQNVGGTGILVRSGGVSEVIALASGRISDIAVTAGDTVVEGQVVARMSQPEAAEQVREARAQLAALKAQNTQSVSYADRDVALQAKLLGRQRETVEQSRMASEETVRSLQEKLRIQQQLVQEGLLTKETLLNTRGQLDAARQKISDGGRELAQIAVSDLDRSNQRSSELRTNLSKIEQQERTVAQLERDLAANAEIVAHQTGRVLEVLVEQGAVVSRGQAILTFDQTGRAIKELEAVLFVPSSYGKQVQVGMPAMIAPSTVRQEEFGMMLGRVTYVSDYPATQQGLRRILKNEKLTSGLAGADAPYEIRADLIVDSDTVSRYRWSSSKGPPLKIQSGTLATAQITVASRRPIEMVIPLVREYTGL